MRFVDNLNHHDPAFNLALEEYVLRNADLSEDILLFYINQPSIIIGKHQNTLEEINAGYVEANEIKVVRRLSGGGAVYHDLGNLNFSFITQYHPNKVQNFSQFTLPVVQAINRLGVNAEVNGRNDITVDGFKVSGNAQYITRDRMYSHGTLLFRSDLSCVAEALHVKAGKIESKGIKSIRSRVANISEFFENTMTINEFRAYLLENLFPGQQEPTPVPLTPADWIAVEELAENRYRSWDWNYGRSPDFNVQRTHRFPSGEIDMRINVQNGLIREVVFYGDYFSMDDSSQLEEILTGLHYSESNLTAALEKIDTSRYFLGVPSSDFIASLISPQG